MTTRLLQLALTLPLLVMLAACGSTTDIDEQTGPPPSNGGSNGATNGGTGGNGEPPADEPTPISEITTDNALLLTRSSLAMIGQLVIIGDIANAMVHRGAHLLVDDSDRSPVNLDECNHPEESGPGFNQLTFVNNASGFFIPPGPGLRASFTDCEIENQLVSGALDIAAVTYSGEPGSAFNDWSLTAIVVMGPIEFTHPNATLTTFTDKFAFHAQRDNGILTVDIAIAADPDAGMTGGVNAQHFLSQAKQNQYAINYQFRPFQTTTTDNGASDEYSVVIRSHADGASRLERYTTTPFSEIQLTASTDPDNPLIWQGGKPASYTDTPDSGEVEFSEGDGRIQATVNAEGVILTINDGAAVTTQSVDWETLLSPPES